MALPPWLQRVKEYWIEIFHPIGRTISWILLSILWLVVFGIYGIIMRLGSLLQGRAKPGWKETAPEFEESMRHQF